jgi:DNA-binding MarR family transcriptional regulator
VTDPDPPTATSTVVSQAANPVAELAAHVRTTVVPLARVLRQQIGGELTATQLSVLGSILRHGPVRMSDLAARERLSAPMITKVVDALVARELVQRVRDPDDGRSWRAEVSLSGRRWLAASRERRDRWLSARLSQLDDDDRSAIAAALPALERLVGHEP